MQAGSDGSNRVTEKVSGFASHKWNRQRSYFERMTLTELTSRKEVCRSCRMRIVVLKIKFKTKI